MATDRATLARSRFRTAVRRKSWSSRPGTPASLHAVSQRFEAGARPARQRVGVGARSGGAGAPGPLCLASALRAGAPAAAERRPRRARAEDGVARRHAGAGVGPAGVPGTLGGEDA